MKDEEEDYFILNKGKSPFKSMVFSIGFCFISSKVTGSLIRYFFSTISDFIVKFKKIQSYSI